MSACSAENHTVSIPILYSVHRICIHTRAYSIFIVEIVLKLISHKSVRFTLSYRDYVNSGKSAGTSFRHSVCFKWQKNHEEIIY